MDFSASQVGRDGEIKTQQLVGNIYIQFTQQLVNCKFPNWINSKPFLWRVGQFTTKLYQ